MSEKQNEWKQEYLYIELPMPKIEEENESEEIKNKRVFENILDDSIVDYNTDNGSCIIQL